MGFRKPYSVGHGHTPRNIVFSGPSCCEGGGVEQCLWSEGRVPARGKDLMKIEMCAGGEQVCRAEENHRRT